ncbi:MAG: tRNA 5-methoxyuridine(34)/uridine 5-oxyacetic acid(34) synthase CmoB, partial [Marinobacter sp.]
MVHFDWRTCFGTLLTELDDTGQNHWAERIKSQLTHRFDDNPHGDLGRWQSALDSLPIISQTTPELNTSAITLSSPHPLNAGQQQELEVGLRGLMPWRKGPFNFFGTHIDTEWRSDWKWDRVSPYLADLSGRRILDVGCGSGYHCWRMLGEGAARVIGIDPGLLFMFQFLSVKRYLGNVPVDLLPIRMEDLPEGLEAFDTTFSMGVLYHRRSPLDHLLELKGTLRRGGELVLETL